MEEETNRSKRGFGPPIQSSKILENAAPAERDSKLKSEPRKKSACKKESQLQRERDSTRFLLCDQSFFLITGDLKSIATPCNPTRGGKAAFGEEDLEEMTSEKGLRPESPIATRAARRLLGR